MAYVNLVSQSAADKAEAFCRIRDFICKRNGTYDYSTTGIDWTLWDAVYAVDEDNPQLGDYFVIFSAGESGDEDLYFKFEWVSGYFKIRGYQSWDPSTHAGANVYNTSNNMTFAETLTSSYISIYGNLDFVVSIQDDSGTYWHGVCFGKIEKPSEDFDETVATCSSTLTAGSDVSIALDSVPSSWKVGSEVIIRTIHTDNMATVEVEYITIKTIVGNTITADLTNNYTANSKLTDFLCYVCSGSTQTIVSLYSFIDALSFVGRGGGYAIPAFSSSYYDPCPYEDSYLMNKGLLKLNTSGWPIGTFPNLYILPGWPVSLSNGDIFVDKVGNNWRIAYFEGNISIALKEV